MKKVFTFFCILFLLGLGSQTILAQLLTEDFSYTAGAALSANGWTVHSGATTNVITVVTPGLSLTGITPYPSSGGNAVKLNNNGQDVNRRFVATQADTISSGNVYASFLVNVSAVGTSPVINPSGDYFFHFGDYGNGVITGSTLMSTSDFWAHVYCRKSNTPDSSLTFGISKGSLVTGTTPVFSDSIYSRNTTYLLVVKYEFIPGAGNSQVSLFVFGAGGDWTSEPGTPNAGPTSDDAPQFGTGLIDAPELSFVCLRQGTAANGGPTLVIDGLHVGTTWSVAPLPVELTAFNATVTGKSVELAWSTATEVNNSGFALERKTLNSSWSKVAFVDGHGATNAPHSYSYTDLVDAGLYSYRLKQIDRDGKFEYSKQVEAAVGLTASDYTLGQNYPNPFNPSTTISFAVKSAQKSSIKVFNMLGQQVETLFDGIAQADQMYHVQFDASNLGSGTYYYVLQTGETRQVKKMVLLK